MASTKQAVFPPEVLARITPEVSLERHLALGLRPSLRQYDEFRTLSANPGSLTDLGTNSLVGLVTVRNGDTHVFCGITLGVTETNESDDFLSADTAANKNAAYATVYPVVEIARGRTGAPTDEEMILSQQIHNHVLHLHVLPLLLLTLVPGYQLTNETTGESYVAYPDDLQMSADDLRSLSSTINITKKKYAYVLYAHIKVFSRVGPLFDVVHYALTAALKNTVLPRVFLSDSGIDPNVRVPVRSRGNFGHLSQGSGRFCFDGNTTLALPLQLDAARIGVSSLFGLVDLETEQGTTSVLLADLEGEAEEACAESRLTIVRNGDTLTHVSITGGGANVTLETFRRALQIAKSRAQVVTYGK
ncbi:hypothetical protein HF325_001644 [Metschnikowia pulcherrima]|uniref:Ribosomal RNA-processing protein 43 n=1 Tax=Metschnikowia pulcherrima TaxID=27326 RepID=A0A8H7LBQ8_9ASCO|nr:hypothetical protein HF325_001644 [Metschnikowia pulcherrima]